MFTSAKSKPPSHPPPAHPKAHEAAHKPAAEPPKAPTAWRIIDGASGVAACADLKTEDEAKAEAARLGALTNDPPRYVVQPVNAG